MVGVVYITPVFGNNAVNGRFIFAVMGINGRGFSIMFLGGGLSIRRNLLEHESELSEDMWGYFLHLKCSKSLRPLYIWREGEVVLQNTLVISPTAIPLCIE